MLTFQEEDLSADRTDAFYPGRTVSSSNTCHFPEVPFYFSLEHILQYQKAVTCSLNTYEISRTLFFLIEQISIFQEDLISSYRADTIFQETLCNRTDRNLLGR